MTQLPSVYYLSNAAVYLDDGQNGILIDGLYDPIPEFDPPAESFEQAIFNRISPFEHLSALLFTHQHKDHCSPSKIQRLMQMYPTIDCQLPNELNLPGLTAFSSPHLLDKKNQILHQALFFSFGGQNFFISGDCDPVYLQKKLPSSIRQQFCNCIHYAFVNPFFLSLTPGRRFLEELAPKHICVYHLPLSVPDPLKYHETLKRGIAKWTLSTVSVEPMLQFMKKLQ